MEMPIGYSFYRVMVMEQQTTTKIESLFQKVFQILKISWMMCDQMNPFDYWHVVNNVIRGRNLVWQPLKVSVVDMGQTRRRSELRQRRQYPHREK
uniref:Uncharacterized protein n=1 Tax=Caenorhabditis japonica TaxID=281687 RepID=A0A8R1ET51_CAEJA